MLIVDNITNLFNININNYALAAVEDTPDCIKHKKRCNIPENSPYINSGVMILNLEMWRQAAENDLFWSFIKENSKKFAINDQDVINYVFQNKIKTIPLRFNVTNHCFGFKPNVLPYHKNNLRKSTNIQQSYILLIGINLGLKVTIIYIRKMARN